VTAPPAKASGYRGVWLTILLSTLLGFASISTDLYLPAMPTMGVALGATQGQLELTVSAYLLGFATGQLFWGPMSDRFGRRIPLIVGIFVFVVGAAGCALSTDATQLIACRVVQALGASAAVVIGRAMIRDLFDGNDAARMLSTVMMIMAIAPMIGPFIGAQILALSSWQAIFWMLVVIGMLAIFGVVRIDESLPGAGRGRGDLAEALANYAHHLKNPRLLAYAGILACFGGGVFAYVTGSAFVFIEYHGLSPQAYSVIFAIGIAGIIVANGINRRLVGRIGSKHILLFGTCVSAIAGAATILVGVTGWGGWPALATTLFAYVAMNGLIGANAISGGLSSVERSAGSASALLGFAQYGGGMIGSALVSGLANGTPVPMASAIGGATIGAAIITTALVRSGR
jgi:DHA1 family bicyclomycin/chloramphenicol resistance-like MFS transporter